MARICVVVTLVVCCLVTGSNGTDRGPVSATRECSVERFGVLTMFNGKTSTVAVPCKYRLADIQCGDYRLVVTPGSKLDSDNTFSPDTVLVNIKTTHKENLFVRTTARRLQRFAKSKVRNPWRVKKGNLNSFGLDLADYDSAKRTAVLRKDGAFEVEFSADRASVVVRCYSDSFSAKSQPDTLCGDGEPGTSTTRDEILDMVFGNKDVGQRSRWVRRMTELRIVSKRLMLHTVTLKYNNGSYQYKIFADLSAAGIALGPKLDLATVSVYQQCAAANASDTRDCDYIFLDKATVDCLAGSGTPLIVHYRRCLETACGVDTSAMAPTLAYIKDNCADWLNSTCSADGDCPAARNSTCFEGLCLCTPGYYYSVGQDTCVEECAEDDLQETFLKYPGSYISSHNTNYGVRDDEGSCVEWCRSVTECRTVEYYSSFDSCYLQSVTVLGVPESAWMTGDSDFNIYQKICA